LKRATRKPEDHLPARPPRKSGKRGIGPLEPDEKTRSAEPREAELLSDANKKRGKMSRLPGMEDQEIEALDDKAREYANLRDDRMHLTREEVKAQAELLALMKANKKEIYKHDGLEIKIVIEKEKVKVKIKKDDDED
jgi:hypothetical protein